MLKIATVTATLLTLTALAHAADPEPPAPYADKPGPHEVTIIDSTWKDSTRDREIPFLLVFPKDLATQTTPLPLIVFSHGLGASRTSYQQYAERWASYGYIVICPQHHGSDTASMGKGAMSPANDIKNFLDRDQDIHFVLDQAELLNAGKLDDKDKKLAPLKGKIDLKHIGMAGHSFGAITTTAIVGQKYEPPALAARANRENNDAPDPAKIKLADDRITAAIAMSPYAPLRTASADAVYAPIKIPVFYLTGTNDNLFAKPESRRLPYDHSTPAGTALLIFNGADHFTFAPTPPATTKPDKAEFQKLIRESTTAFWDAHLKDGAKAKTWFNTELEKELGNKGKLEIKK